MREAAGATETVLPPVAQTADREGSAGEAVTEARDRPAIHGTAAITGMAATAGRAVPGATAVPEAFMEIPHTVTAVREVPETAVTEAAPGFW